MMITVWKETFLGEVLTERRETPTPESLENGEVSIISKIRFKHGKIELRSDGNTKTGMILVRPGDLVISGINAAKGAIAIYDERNDKPIAGTIHYGSYIPNKELVEIKYLWWFLRSATFREIVQDHIPGGIKTELKSKRFLSVPILLPPLDEQRHILERVEALAARIAKAQYLRNEAQENVESLQASMMNAVFEGKLELSEENDESADELVKRNLHERRAKWEVNIRAKSKDPNKAKYDEPQLPNTNEFPSLPSHWAWATWEMLLAHEDGAFRRGPFGSTLRKSVFVESGYKIYEQYCPINDDCSFGRYYITPELFKKLKSFEVKVGDFLISCSGVTLGRITQVPKGSAEGVINQALLRVRINNEIIDDKYFLYCFRAPFFQRLLFENSKGSAIPNLKGVKELKAIPLPLPPLDEQRRIVAYLDSVQARLASLRELQSVTGEELDALLPSVLDRAFKGEL